MWWPFLLTDRDEMSNFHRGHSIDDSYQVSVHLAKRFQRNRFKKIGQSVMDHNEMCTLQRGPSIDASYRVSIHLVKRFQRRKKKKNRPIRNKNCLWQPCLLMNQNKMSTLYREPSIVASYQGSVHLAKGFQRRRLKYEKLTYDGCQMMAKAHLAFGKVS